jgi:prevent-host-death family protein
MKAVQLHEAKTHLSDLIERVQRGEEVFISKYGKIVAKIVAVEVPIERTLGFHPITFTSNLLEPTDQETIDSFYQD